jgi:hypothetical protein
VTRLSNRDKRLLLYFSILLAVATWRYVPRPWKPARTIETAHYTIASTATAEQTEQIARVVEILYQFYSNKFSTLPTFTPNHPPLKLLLYKDRAEMRRINPGLGWAEAFYRKPYCRAYYSAEETNPYHWMLHEAVHQLNSEVAHVNLEKWLEEGIAEYFSTSRIKDNQLLLGHPDPNTYPVWWLDEIATDADVNKKHLQRQRHSPSRHHHQSRRPAHEFPRQPLLPPLVDAHSLPLRIQSNLHQRDKTHPIRRQSKLHRTTLRPHRKPSIQLARPRPRVEAAIAIIQSPRREISLPLQEPAS